MFSRLFSTHRLRPPARVPSDSIVWAIGDIHGRADLADRLIQAIRADLSAATAPRKVVVFLGDSIDRGPDSRGVLDQICHLAAEPMLEVQLIWGNHEDRMLGFLSDPGVGPSWCDYGGRETLASYGVRAPEDRDDGEGWAHASRDLERALPASHKALLERHIFSASIGDYFFCHAGARPGVALADQRREDLLWIRETFLNHPDAFEQVVVHGHTPVETVVSNARTISLDTGAYATNTLSAVRLEGATRVLLQASGRAGRVTVETSPLLNPSGRQLRSDRSRAKLLQTARGRHGVRPPAQP